MSAQDKSITCTVCHHHCRLSEGQIGFCRARKCHAGRILPENYGHITSIAVDPVEKKPLAEWHPGCSVLSVGSYGCNMRCPFCQNWQISQMGREDVGWRKVSPAELIALGLCARRKDPRMVGLAFTYNEPLVGWEYVRDCAMLAHERGLEAVLVSNGCVNTEVIDQVAPLIDAANIDLKSFSAAYYHRCAGDLDLVKRAITRFAKEKGCHLEVTTLIVPHMNDTPEEISKIAAWLASVDSQIVLHVTRFFPRWKLKGQQATAVQQIKDLAAVAHHYLSHVYTGNC